MQYRCSVDDKIVVFDFKGTNIVIVALITHSFLKEKSYGKPKKSNGVLYIS